MKTLDVVDSTIDPKEFFVKYVKTRTPVVIRGLIRDEGFQVSLWVCTLPQCSPPGETHLRRLEKTDLEYLSKKAGHVMVQVEPIHPESKQFGTDIERIDMKFSEFLEGLKREDGELRYLTTQYSADPEGGDEVGEEDEGDVTVYPPPTNALRDDFPSAPKIIGNLVLQQVNLWIGKSKNGASSGLVRSFVRVVSWKRTHAVHSTTISMTMSIAYSRATNDLCSFPRFKHQTCILMEKSTPFTPTG